MTRSHDKFGSARVSAMVWRWDADHHYAEGKEQFAAAFVGQPVKVKGSTAGKVVSAEATEQGVLVTIEFPDCPWLYGPAD